MDTVGTAALVTLSPKGGMSLNITISYLGRALAGGNLLVEAQVCALRVGWPACLPVGTCVRTIMSSLLTCLQRNLRCVRPAHRFTCSTPPRFPVQIMAHMHCTAPHHMHCTAPHRMQVLKVGQTIATIDVQLREEGSGMLVAQVREQGKKERKDTPWG